MLEDYAHAVTAEVGNAGPVIVVGHSLGGFTAPLVCDELQADGLVYLAGMIPLPGETFGDWWTNTGHILCRDDQFFPAPFMRRRIQQRLGIEPPEIPGGHYATLTHPDAIARTLSDFSLEMAQAHNG